MFTIPSNITFQSTLRTSTRALSFRYSGQNSVCISPPQGVPSMDRPCLMTCHFWNQNSKQHCKCRPTSEPYLVPSLECNHLTIRGTMTWQLLPSLVGCFTTLLAVDVEFYLRYRWKSRQFTNSHTTSLEKYCNRCMWCAEGQEVPDTAWYVVILGTPDSDGDDSDDSRDGLTTALVAEFCNGHFSTCLSSLKTGRRQWCWTEDRLQVLQRSTNIGF